MFSLAIFHFYHVFVLCMKISQVSQAHASAEKDSNIMVFMPFLFSQSLLSFFFPFHQYCSCSYQKCPIIIFINALLISAFLEDSCRTEISTRENFFFCIHSQISETCIQRIKLRVPFEMLYGFYCEFFETFLQPILALLQPKLPLVIVKNEARDGATKIWSVCSFW